MCYKIEIGLKVGTTIIHQEKSEHSFYTSITNRFGGDLFLKG